MGLLLSPVSATLSAVLLVPKIFFFCFRIVMDFMLFQILNVLDFILF